MNLVTASPHAAAQNYGYDQHFEHDLRYEMADEWVQAVKALWDTWDSDALTLDETTGVFADHTKVHHADFAGQFYKTRGPLNTVPSPQGHPVLCQAGGSPRGQPRLRGLLWDVFPNAPKPDPVALRPYYEELIAEYLPPKIRW